MARLAPQRATRAGIEDVELSLNVVSQSEGESNRDAGDNQDDSGGGQIGQEVVEQDEDEDEDEDNCYLDPKLAVIWYSGAMEALKNASPQAFEEYMQGLRHRGVDPEGAKRGSTNQAQVKCAVLRRRAVVVPPRRYVRVV